MGKIAGTCFNDAVFGVGLTAQASEGVSCGITFYKPFHFFDFAFRLVPILDCINCGGYLGRMKKSQLVQEVLLQYLPGEIREQHEHCNRM